jgi:hypothetical protein
MRDEVTGDPDPGAAPMSEVRGNRAAIAGLLFCVLYLVGFLAVRGYPQSSWSDEEIRRYYESQDGDRLRLVALYVVPFAGIAFLWFLAAFRDHVVRLAGTENTMLSTVQILTGSIYVAMQFSAAATLVTVPLAFDDGALSMAQIDTVRPLLLLGDTIMIVFALRSAGVFMIAGTTRALRAGLFPRWFAVASYLLALVLMVTSSSFRGFVLIFPLWIGVVSCMILLRRQHLLSGRDA